MDVLGRLLVLLTLLMVGTGLRVSGVLDDARTARLNAVAYYAALPALVFVATYDRAIGQLLSPALFAGLAIVLFTTAALAWVIHRNRSSRPRRSVAIIQSYHSNIAYLGLPLVAATFSADVTAIASVIVGVVSLIQAPLTILLLVTINDADIRIRREVSRVTTNPVLIALVLGMVVGTVGLSVPPSVASGLDAVGSLALPLALLCVGASLKVDAATVDLGATGSVVALKIVCMPALAWIVFSLLSVDVATFTASVVMLGTPTAVSTYVFVGQIGGDKEFASLNVFVTTLLSVFTLLFLVNII